ALCIKWGKCHNMEVIETMKNGGQSAGAAAAVVFDACYFMACDFSLTRSEHCNRIANKVARELARLAKFSVTRDWFKGLQRILYLLLQTM
uniref:RNase H type-1 domain-containing protein n=1 Tax=Aegilops tauschii subsp. strangulata TaxID=200361 RepID=A0A453LBU0_AEGTS